MAALFGCSNAPVAARAPSPPRPSAPPPAPPWSRFGEIMELSPVTAEPIRAQGHPDVPPRAVTRVSPNARDAYLALVTDSILPADALIAMTHQTEEGARGPTYVMERSAGAWRFLVLDARGAVQRDRPAECAGCHGMAVAEGLFGLPRPKQPASPGQPTPGK